MAQMYWQGFTLKADWDRDDTYDHALSDITAYMLECRFRYGMSAPYQEVAPPARMEILLDNQDGAWSVDKSGATFASVFRKNVLVRLSGTILTDGNPSDSGLFVGMITEIRIAPGALGEKTATLVVEDPMLRLLDAEYHPPLLTNVTTDQALLQMFEDAIVPYPYPQSYWMLGIAGASELEQTTTVFENTITSAFTFNTGAATIPYVGDNADEGHGVSAQSYIRDVVAAEGGGRFFWFAPSGEFRFLNRHYTSVTATVSDAAGLEIVQDPPPVYHYADDLVNSIEISYELKKVGASASVLYTAPNVPFSIAAGATRTFTARYQDPNVPTARVGGINVISPVASADYTANTASDGSGSDVTSSVIVSCEPGASSAKLSLTNPTGATAYITLLQVRGTALTAYAKETATALDGESVFNYGVFKKSLTLPLVEDAEFVQDYANSVVTQYKEPLGRFERLTYIESNGVFDSGDFLFGIGVGSGIFYYDPTIEDTTQDYLIVGHEGVIKGGNVYEKTLVLEPALRNAYWALGYTGRSELEISTVIAL